MANVPIVTSVTKAELDALVTANGLEEGLQYNVTDKNWLLLAVTNSTLICIDKLIIKRSEPEEITPFLKYIPDYIVSDTYIVDSEEITTDISETGSPISFVGVEGYCVDKVYIDGRSGGEAITVQKIFGVTYNIEIGGRDNCFQIDFPSLNDLAISISGVGAGSRTRIYLNFIKSPF